MNCRLRGCGRAGRWSCSGSPPGEQETTPRGAGTIRGRLLPRFNVSLAGTGLSNCESAVCSEPVIPFQLAIPWLAMPPLDLRVPSYVAESSTAVSAVARWPRITRAEDVYTLCAAMARYRVEVFRVLLLNSRHDVLKRVTVSRGSLASAVVHPREVFRPAILASAAAIIVVHNHPSGDPEPSAEDVEVTRRLAKAGELLGIPLLDHVIVARGCRYVSLRERGKM